MAPRARRQDAGSMHVVEAIVVASIMLGSILFVVSYEAPPAETDMPRALLGQRVRDALAILNDTPVHGSAFGSDVLSVSLLECLQDDCSRLTTKLDQLMPQGTKYAVYLSTGEGLYPIYEPHTPSGEAVTARRLIEPGWSYVFLATAQSVVNPLEDPLVVYALPIVSANPLHQGGSALTITAYGERDADRAAYVMKTSGTTRAVGIGAETAPPAVSYFFHAGDGVPRGALDVRAQAVDVLGMPTKTPIPFSLRIAESGGGVVPAGTTATVQLPHGWSARASQAQNDAHWLILSNATDANGSARGATITAKLRHAVTSGHVDLSFTANYTGEASDVYAFSASLTSGAYARAALLVRADQRLLPSPFEVPTLVGSIPRPLGAGATTTWTLAASASQAMDIERIEIAEEEGRAIFGSVVGVAGGGTWRTTGDKLVWEGDAQVASGAPFELVFQVTSSSVRGPSLDRAPFVPSVDLDGHVGALAHEIAPGLYTGTFLPSSGTSKGYSTTSTGLTTEHPIRSESVYRTTPLPGTASYATGPALGIDDALFGSALIVEDRTLSPGGTARFHVETQSMVYALALLGLEPKVTFNLYPPWTGDARTPVVHETLFDASLSGTLMQRIDTNGDLQPDRTDVGRLSATVDVPRNWLYGAYIAEAEVSWLETIAGEKVARSARLYDHFVLRPSTGELPSSAIYDVHLVAWQEDWG